MPNHAKPHCSPTRCELNTMEKLIILYYLLTTFIILNKGDDDMMGQGKWVIVSIEKCEEDAMFTTKIEAETHRLNRSHIGFSFKVHLEEEINEGISVRIDICKYVDGGCKAYQTLADECVIRFCEKYAQKNIDKAFAMAGLEGWPLLVNDYAVDDYIFDLEELPTKSMFGDFVAKGFLIKGVVEFACVKAAVRFEKCED